MDFIVVGSTITNLNGIWEKEIFKTFSFAIKKRFISIFNIATNFTFRSKISKVFWYINIYISVHTTESSQLSSRFKYLKAQFVRTFCLGGTLNCTSNYKIYFVLNRFEFLTKRSVNRLVVQNITIVKMQSNNWFVNLINDLWVKKFRSLFMIPILLLVLIRTLSIWHFKFNFSSIMMTKSFCWLAFST